MGLPEDLQAEIASRSLPRGGWASGNGSRASVETTCYGLMALHDRSGTARDDAIDFLLRMRNRDGSWPAFDGDDAEGCWTTALVLIALRFAKSNFTEFGKSVSWLLDNKGQEGYWFWQWKFKTVDRAVHFNPDKFGWSWFPGTLSWVHSNGLYTYRAQTITPLLFDGRKPGSNSSGPGNAGRPRVS